MPSIKLYRRKLVIKSVMAFRIVEHLDVVKDGHSTANRLALAWRQPAWTPMATFKIGLTPVFESSLVPTRGLQPINR